MMLQIQAGRSCGLFAEVEKLPDLISELSQRVVVGGGQGTVAHRGKLHRITMNISAIYDRTFGVKTRYRTRTSRCPYVARSA